MTLEGVRFKTVRPAAAYLKVLMGYQIKLVHTVPNSIFHEFGCHIDAPEGTSFI